MSRQQSELKPCSKCAALQARIDELMQEYCPDEMTEEQWAEWAKHQVPSPRPSEWVDVRDQALSEVVPKIQEMVSASIVIAGCVSFDTIRKAIEDLKATPPGEG